MRTVRRAFWLGLMLFVPILMLTACQSGGADEDTALADALTDSTAITVHGVNYTDTVLSEEEIGPWSRENSLNDEAGSRPGIVVSPYFTMTANGVEIPVFAERTANGIHNLAYIEVAGASGDGSFVLDVDIGTHTERKNPVVLPESSGVAAAVNGKTTTARVTAYGSYTFT